MSEIASIAGFLIKLMEKNENRDDALIKDVVKPLFESMRIVTDKYRTLISEAINASSSAQELTASVRRLEAIRNSYLTDRTSVVALSETLEKDEHLDPRVRKFAELCVECFYGQNLPFLPHHTGGYIILRLAEGAERGTGFPLRIIADHSRAT